MDKNIKDKLTSEFLETLTEVAKQYGWSGDYIEIERFVGFCYSEANIDYDPEDLEPYE